MLDPVRMADAVHPPGISIDVNVLLDSQEGTVNKVSI